MRRQVPPDDVLARIFKQHAGESTRMILVRYGWDVSLGVLQMYRRKLGRRSAIAGVASMSQAKFREAMELTLLDKTGGGL